MNNFKVKPKERLPLALWYCHELDKVLLDMDLKSTDLNFVYYAPSGLYKFVDCESSTYRFYFLGDL